MFGKDQACKLALEYLKIHPESDLETMGSDSQGGVMLLGVPQDVLQGDHMHHLLCHSENEIL